MIYLNAFCSSHILKIDDELNHDINVTHCLRYTIFYHQTDREKKIRYYYVRKW